MIKPERRVLIIEDESSWQKLLKELLQEVATEIDCTIEVILAQSFADALDSLKAMSYDCVTVDNKLPDGRMAKTVLDRIAGLDHEVYVIVISGVVNPGDVRDFFREYNVSEFFWKHDFDPRQFKQVTAGLLAPISNKPSKRLPYVAKGKKAMDWNTIISLAVSAVSPYAVTLAMSAATTAGTKLGEAAFEGLKGLWEWIRQTIGGSDDESAKQAWESFRQDPERNRDALVDAIRRLSPEDDKALRGYVQGLIEDVQLRKGANLFAVLDSSKYYTLNDLKRICSRVNPRWADDLGSDPTREALARWVVTYAPTRNRESDLIAAMLETNPTAILQ